VRPDEEAFTRRPRPLDMDERVHEHAEVLVD